MRVEVVCFSGEAIETLRPWLFARPVGGFADATSMSGSDRGGLAAENESELLRWGTIVEGGRMAESI